MHALVFAGIAAVIVSALVLWAGTNIKASRSSVLKEKAIEIAEAGIDYYRWHLAHASTDFTDGTGTAGPYSHDFFDKDGAKIGTYTLEITPPIPGSTLVTIKSTGRVAESTTIKRSIKTTLAIPSMAKFAFVSNNDMRFGVGTEVFGPIHSNGGIRFDGLAHNIVSSARASYDDPDHDDSGSEKLEFGVHTHVNAPPGSGTTDTYRPLEVPPAAMQVRTDVFESGRQVSVPSVDFVGLTNDLAQIKAAAQTSSGKYFAASGALGYKVVFNAQSATDTYSVYKVNTLRAAPSGCVNPTPAQPGWATWSIGTGGGALTAVTGSPFTIPANGLIFFEDNVWVEGSISNTRVTVASGKFPDNASTRTNITVNNDLMYSTHDGHDVISLIAQNNINVGLYSADALDIEAALMAQNGRVGRYYYNTSCGADFHKSQITLYGMIATNQRYGFSWTGNDYDCGGSIGNIGSGYCTRNITYDANLLYGPPPSFPLTSDQYSTISWEEVQ